MKNINKKLRHKIRKKERNIIKNSKSKIRFTFEDLFLKKCYTSYDAAIKDGPHHKTVYYLD